ncbi:DEAD/DEAH box helicase family protein [Nostoc sp. 2RC]|uniref:DEAD/DEAH box helicase family protein n=1 Tax=Nostoc sp. 2RC TaxID=2485484 RepID=UPI0016233A37|nr:DEAD/DEAH box helicase family protein [Nostoc sp. 2RC]MBC1237224.1 DEAD/DEAH box helicase family protein [Nostoc sp. 2RC]
MTQLDKELAKRLKSGPAFLLLGQNYLKLESGIDPFLSEIVRKYGGIADSYSQILTGSACEASELALAWMQQRCERFASPEWLETVASFPWSGVYTSAIDTICLKAFRNNWRELQPIYDSETLNPSDPRNRHRLHCTFLFGCVNQDDKNKRPPLNEDELDIRDSVANALARRLPELITPLGTLVLEGYAGDLDWFSPQKLTPVVERLNQAQVHIFSADEAIKQNSRIARRVQEGKVILYDENLAVYLLRAQEVGYLILGEPPEKDEYGRRITLEEKSLTVPLNLWNQVVSRSATILDDTILIEPPHIGDNRLYSEFRAFLAESSNKPIWAGYARGFAFKRNFESQLQEIVIKRLKSNELQDEPIILCGQSGTGKSIALGHLAYSIHKERKYPVLFIEPRSKLPLLSDLDAFCKWAEDSGASATLIIWDGMLEQEQYYELTKRLASRGRKAVVVGSCYGEANTKNNFVQAPSSLANNQEGINEISEFIAFIEKFVPGSSADLKKLSEKGSDRFLVALYRLLPPTRSQIRLGLAKEVQYAEQDSSQSSINNLVSTTFATALLKSGLITQNHLLSSENLIIDGEEVTLLQKLIRLVMVPGRLGMNLPLEILMRAINTGRSTDFVSLIKKLKTDIIQWYEDEAGNIEIGARHRIEAQEITKSLLGSAKAEVECAKEILLNVREKGNFNSETEILFAVSLIRNMRTSFYSSYFAFYFPEIAEVLRQLREDYSVQNPSLMLQEATLLTDTVQQQRKNLEPVLSEKDCIELLNRAENVLRLALDQIGFDKKNKGRRSRLLVELASVLGTKFNTLKEIQCHEKSLKSLKQSQEVAFNALSLDAENYYPIDVLLWTSKDILLDENIDLKVRTEIEANVFHVLTLAESEEYPPEQQERLQNRRYQIGDLIGRNDISEEAFQALSAMGSSAGYYLRAYSIVKDVLFKSSLKEDEVQSCNRAVYYLKENWEKINQDSRSLYLLLKIWWLSKAKTPLFAGERKTVSFSQEDWKDCLRIIEALMKTTEFYENLSLTYLKGLANFHLDRISTSLEIFKELENESSSIGRRRILRSYLMSSSDGSPRKFTGEVAWRHEKSYEPGAIYVSELQRNRITFIPQQFGKPDIRPGESPGEFHIAFNFLGPIADPILYYSQPLQKQK